MLRLARSPQRLAARLTATDRRDPLRVEQNAGRAGQSKLTRQGLVQTKLHTINMVTRGIVPCARAPARNTDTAREYKPTKLNILHTGRRTHTCTRCIESAVESRSRERTISSSRSRAFESRLAVKGRRNCVRQMSPDLSIPTDNDDDDRAPYRPRRFAERR